MRVTFIGDVHGKFDQYLQICDQEEKDGYQTIQVGDMGFCYDPLHGLGDNHRFIKGNHENYFVTHPNDLGDFGYWNGTFYVRGGHSIDQKHRRMYINYWPQEELSIKGWMDCALEWHGNIWSDPDDVLTKIVVSHECPSSIVDMIGNPKILEHYGYQSNWRSQTAKGLQVLLDMYAPKLWVFGHHHKSWRQQVGGTLFVCLNELETFRIETKDWT